MTTTPTSYTLERLLQEIDDRRFRPQKVKDVWQRTETVKKEFDEGKAKGDALVFYHEENHGLAWVMCIPPSVLFGEFEVWQIVALSFQSTRAFRLALDVLMNFRVAKWACDYVGAVDPNSTALFCEWYGYP